ncbi:MAG: hypothetical protein WCI97_06545 [Bacteroidota bacterium]
MNFKKSFLFVLILFPAIIIFYSCNTNNSAEKSKNDSTVTVSKIKEISVHHYSTEFKTNEIIRNIKCLNDSSKSYSLFLPADYDTSKSFPVLLFFDAHARGSLPLKKYISLAQKYHFVFVGSNDSQNGMQISETQNIASTILKDVTERFNINEKLIFASGFSGGSKVACNFGFNNTLVRGVIACAAPFTEQLSAVMNAPDIFLLSGNEDFNLNGMVQADNALHESHFNHQLFVFDGKHDWADLKSFDIAMQWMQQKAMKENLMSNKYLPEKFSDYNSWKQTDVTNENILTQEMNAEQELGKQFTTAGISYWNEKISALQKSKTSKQNFALKKLCARELNYISMMGFAYSESALNQNNLQAAQQFLQIYELADPKNPDVYFLEAIYFSKSNDFKSAIALLKKSAQLGYADYNKLMNEKSFSSIASTPKFEQQVAMKVSQNSEKE